MKAMIKVGSIVQCVNDTFSDRPGRKPIKFPVKGRLYTVVGIVEQPRGIGLRLEEIPDVIRVRHSRTVVRPENATFLATRFKEVVSSEIKIDELTHIEVEN